jgi:hypothetical protein
MLGLNLLFSGRRAQWRREQVHPDLPVVDLPRCGTGLRG